MATCFQRTSTPPLRVATAETTVETRNNLVMEMSSAFNPFNVGATLKRSRLTHNFLPAANRRLLFSTPLSHYHEPKLTQKL